MVELSSLRAASEIDAEQPAEEHVILLAQSTAVFKNVILYIWRALDESEPRTKNWEGEIISCPYPVMILVSIWHWALEEDKIYLHIVE